MNTKPEPEVILPSDERAARKVTVTGWLSRDGRFYGDDERLARWAGSTHAVCDTCGTTTTKSWTKCEACRDKADLERFNAMPEAPWDGKAMVYSDRFDAFYSDPDDALDALDTYEPDEDSTGGGETLADARLIICRPQHAHLDSEIFHDILQGDECDPPQELLDAIDAFNKTMENVVISWEPGKFRLKLDAEGKVVAMEGKPLTPPSSKFKIGDRVKVSELAIRTFNWATVGRSTTGVAVGHTKDPDCVRVLRDWLKQSEVFHVKFWELEQQPQSP